MRQLFDLWSFDDVQSKRRQDSGGGSYAGSMPCDTRWSNEKVDLLRRWVDADTPSR